VQARPLAGEGATHLREHVARDGRDHVDAQTRPQAVLHRLEERRPAVAHLHLHLRRDRDLAPAVGHELPFAVGEVTAVNVGRVRVEQPEPLQPLHHLPAPGQPAHADVDRDLQAEVTRDRPFLAHDVVGTEARPARRHRHGDQPVVTVEVGRADALDIFPRHHDRAIEPAGLERRVGRAVGVDGTDTSILEPLNRRIRMFRRVVDVRPVDQCRDARIQALERTGQIAGVDVLWTIERCERVEHLDEIVLQRRVRRTATDRCLPGMAVRVDEPR